MALEQIKMPQLGESVTEGTIEKWLVNYTDASITEENIKTFIKAYQSKKIISMKELWIMPTMLKIAIVEYIKNVCDAIKMD